MKKLRNEEGVILLTVILLMAVIALLGVLTINTTTVDLQISGNQRRASIAFSGGEAGTDLAQPIIERTIDAGTLTPTTVSDGTVDPNPLAGIGLGTEITGGNDYNADTPYANPDLTISVGDATVNVDIDRLYSYTLPGGALEFASGYEGTGAAAAGGGIGVLYMIDSVGSR
jgi:Tfp pilus assembly protein PilX